MDKNRVDLAHAAMVVEIRESSKRQAVEESRRRIRERSLHDPLVSAYLHLHDNGSIPDWTLAIERLVLALSDENAELKRGLLHQIRTRPPEMVKL